MAKAKAPSAEVKSCRAKKATRRERNRPGRKRRKAYRGQGKP